MLARTGVGNPRATVTRLRARARRPQQLANKFTVGLGSTETRVGLATFASNATVKFTLGSHSTNSALMEPLNQLAAACVVLGQYGSTTVVLR